MGLFSDFFSFLTDITDDNYIVSSERWFDNVYKRINHIESSEGRLEIRSRNLYRKLYATFSDGTSIVITDENDDGRELRYVNLNSEQKKQLLRDGYVTIREYD